MTMPGLTAEASLYGSKTDYRAVAGDPVSTAAVTPQLSCWRVCYDISDTNHQLSECYATCTAIKNSLSVFFN
jgi:hypothetical protein